MSATAAELDPVAGVDANGRPVFLSTSHSRFTANPNQSLSTEESFEWRCYQLWKKTNGMIRRDTVYKSLTQSDYSPVLQYQMLGTPYPIIEPAPTLAEVMGCLRWYEHGAPLAWLASMYVLFSIPRMKNRPVIGSIRRTIYFLGATLSECSMGFRSLQRLQGLAENDYECRRYGVVEDKARLELKARRWAQYADYKREWTDRWNYYNWGMRPGESWQLWSPCIFPPLPVYYNTTTDYPLRKNPIKVSDRSLRTLHLDSPNFVEYPREGTRETVNVYAARPEVKYIYRGPPGTEA